MMRGKPSVSSRSASTVVVSAFAFTAASAIGESFRLIRSIEIIGKARHVISQAERVVAYQFFRAIGGARFQSLDDVDVVADRTVGAILLADGLAADHAHVGEQILGEVDQHGVAAEPDDGLMEFDVDVGILVEMRAHFAVLEGGEHPAQAGDFLFAGDLRDQARRHAFQRRPGGDHLDHLALGLAHYIDTAARHRAHEAFAFELRHRLAHRRATDAEVVRQLALVEADVVAAAVDVHRYDGVLQGGVGLVLEARGVVDGPKRRLRRRRRANLRGRARTQTDATGQPALATHDWYTICQMRGRAQYDSRRDRIALLLKHKSPPV